MVALWHPREESIPLGCLWHPALGTSDAMGLVLASYCASLVAGGPAASSPGLPELLLPSFHVSLCSLRPHN